MDRTALELRRFLEKTNLRVESMTRTGGGHYKAVCTHGNTTRFIILPATPSDHRWRRNKLSEIRKLFGIGSKVAQAPDPD